MALIQFLFMKECETYIQRNYCVSKNISATNKKRQIVHLAIFFVIMKSTRIKGIIESY